MTPAPRKTFSPTKVLLFTVALAALLAFVFPEFMEPYYSQTKKYVFELQSRFTKGEERGPENTQTGVDTGPQETAPPPSGPRPKETSREIGGNSTPGEPADSSEAAQQIKPMISDENKKLPSPFPPEKTVIHFIKNSNYFSPDDIDTLKRLARQLIARPNDIALISGYTDTTGTAHYNKKLSEFRANIVRGFLLGQGVPPEQMRSEGRGMQNPIDNNNFPEGRKMNRRVEITILPRGEQ